MIDFTGMEVYLNPNINVHEYCENWEDCGDCYMMNTDMNEYITINKETGKIKQYGYNQLLFEMFTNGELVVM